MTEYKAPGPIDPVGPSSGAPADEYWETLSDELRSPLVALVGLSERALRARGTDHERIAAIRAHAKELLGLVGEGTRDLAAPSESVLASPRAAVELAAEEIREKAESRGLRFWTDTRAGVPAVARFDSARVRSVIGALVEAALRLTSSGFVGVRTRFSAPASCVAEVLDTSGGMSQAEYERLSRRPGPRDELESFAGFGLARARSTAQAIGGDVEYERTPSGSLYRFRFPIALENTELRRQHGWRAQTGLRGRVLLTHPEAAELHRIRDWLESTGLQTKCAESGRTAVDLALAEHFDLALIHVDTPALDGWTVARALVASGFRGRIVALARSVDKTTRHALVAAGFCGWQLEPLDRRSLLGTVSEHLPQRITGPRA